MKKLLIGTILGLSVATSNLFALQLNNVLKKTNFSFDGKIKFYNESNTEIYGNDKRYYIFDIDLNTQTNIDNNLLLLTGFNFTKEGSTSTSVNDNSIKNNLIYLKYYMNNLNVNFGAIPLKTPFTGKRNTDAHGAGIDLAYFNYKNNTLLYSNFSILDSAIGNDLVDTSNNNIYSFNFFYKMGRYENTLFSYLKVKNIINNSFFLNYFVDLKNYGFNVFYVNTSLNSNFKELNGLTSNKQEIYNIKFKYSIGQTQFNVGYTATTNDGVVTLDKDSLIYKVLPTQQVQGIANAGKKSAFYTSYNYYLNKNNLIGLNYSNINDKTSVNNDQYEIDLKYKYSFSKKNNIIVNYSYLRQSKLPNNKELYIETNFKF